MGALKRPTKHRAPLRRHDGLTPKEAATQFVVSRAKANEPKWDSDGLYAEAAAERAKEWGVPFHEVYEEWAERSAVRAYLGEFSVDEAERLAWVDTVERFAGRK